MKKYTIELSEDQILLIAHCLEDISRFAAGQCEMDHTIDNMLMGLSFDEMMERRNAVRKILNKSKDILIPELSDGVHKGYDGSEFIGNTYQIYRTILHQLANDNNWNNVYSSPALPSGNLGTIKIDVVV